MKKAEVIGIIIKTIDENITSKKNDKLTSLFATRIRTYSPQQLMILLLTAELQLKENSTPEELEKFLQNIENNFWSLVLTCPIKQKPKARYSKNIKIDTSEIKPYLQLGFPEKYSHTLKELKIILTALSQYNFTQTGYDNLINFLPKNKDRALLILRILYYQLTIKKNSIPEAIRFLQQLSTIKMLCLTVAINVTNLNDAFIAAIAKASEIQCQIISECLDRGLTIADLEKNYPKILNDAYNFMPSESTDVKDEQTRTSSAETKQDVRSLSQTVMSLIIYATPAEFDSQDKIAQLIARVRTDLKAVPSLGTASTTDTTTSQFLETKERKKFTVEKTLKDLPREYDDLLSDCTQLISNHRMLKNKSADNSKKLSYLFLEFNYMGLAYGRQIIKTFKNILKLDIDQHIFDTIYRHPILVIYYDHRRDDQVQLDDNTQFFLLVRFFAGVAESVTFPFYFIIPKKFLYVLAHYPKITVYLQNHPEFISDLADLIDSDISTGKKLLELIKDNPRYLNFFIAIKKLSHALSSFDLVKKILEKLNTKNLYLEDISHIVQALEVLSHFTKPIKISENDEVFDSFYDNLFASIDNILSIPKHALPLACGFKILFAITIPNRDIYFFEHAAPIVIAAGVNAHTVALGIAQLMYLRRGGTRIQKFAPTPLDEVTHSNHEWLLENAQYSLEIAALLIELSNNSLFTFEIPADIKQIPEQAHNLVTILKNTSEKISSIKDLVAILNHRQKQEIEKSLSAILPRPINPKPFVDLVCNYLFVATAQPTVSVTGGHVANAPLPTLQN